LRVIPAPMSSSMAPVSRTSLDIPIKEVEWVSPTSRDHPFFSINSNAIDFEIPSDFVRIRPVFILESLPLWLASLSSYTPLLLVALCA